MRILIVDDEPDHVETLAVLLRESGHHVEFATNPLYALSLARGFSPEFILIDLGLPYMDGHEAGRRLRKYFKSARIYAITGRSDEEARRKSAAVGFDGHLVKPVDVRVIEDLLKS
jgi:DNA-binding response OmpR family regulator